MLLGPISPRPRHQSWEGTEYPAGPCSSPGTRQPLFHEAPAWKALRPAWMLSRLTIRSIFQRSGCAFKVAGRGPRRPAFGS